MESNQKSITGKKKTGKPPNTCKLNNYNMWFSQEVSKQNLKNTQNCDNENTQYQNF